MSKLKFNGTPEEFKTLKDKLLVLKKQADEITPHIQAVRDLYKHWTEETRSTSEDLIVSWNNRDDVDHYLDLLEELEAFMNDDSDEEDSEDN